MKISWRLINTIAIIPLSLATTISCSQNLVVEQGQTKVKWQDGTFVITKNEHNQINPQVVFSINLAPEQSWLVPETIKFDWQQWILLDQNNQSLNPYQLISRGFDQFQATINNPRGWIWNPTVKQLQFVLDFTSAIVNVKTVIWQSPISEQVISFQPKIVPSLS